jgi:hypothetical protein
MAALDLNAIARCRNDDGPKSARLNDKLLGLMISCHANHALWRL